MVFILKTTKIFYIGEKSRFNFKHIVYEMYVLGLTRWIKFRIASERDMTNYANTVEILGLTSVAVHKPRLLIYVHS